MRDELKLKTSQNLFHGGMEIDGTMVKIRDLCRDKKKLSLLIIEWKW